MVISNIKIDWSMLKNVIREPLETVLTTLRSIRRSNRQIERTFSSVNNLNNLRDITWDTPAWPLLTKAPAPEADSPVKVSTPAQLSSWLLIILILPLILAMIFAHFILKRGINQPWLRYLLAQLPFFGTTLTLLYLYFTWNPQLIQAITMLTITVLLFVLLVEQVILLLYVLTQGKTKDRQEQS